MRRFILRRAVASVFALMGATLIVFGLSRVVGDPRYLYAQEGYGLDEAAWENLGKQLGLDKPLVVQYFIWLGRVVRGDLGDSLIGRQPVSELIAHKIGNTLQLSLAAFIFATMVGVPLGVLSAVRRGSVLDLVGRGFAALGQAAPPMWVGIMGILILAVRGKRLGCHLEARLQERAYSPADPLRLDGGGVYPRRGGRGDCIHMAGYG
jgi:peptide/nickel transport system permease protein